MSQIYQSMQCTVSSYSMAHNIRNLLYDSWLIKTIHKSKCIIYHLTYYVCSLVDDCWYYICWMNIDYIEPIKRLMKVPSPILHVYADTHYCSSNLEGGPQDVA